MGSDVVLSINWRSSWWHINSGSSTLWTVASRYQVNPKLQWKHAQVFNILHSHHHRAGPNFCTNRNSPTFSSHSTVPSRARKAGPMQPLKCACYWATKQFLPVTLTRHDCHKKKNALIYLLFCSQQHSPLLLNTAFWPIQKANSLNN